MHRGIKLSGKEIMDFHVFLSWKQRYAITIGADYREEASGFFSCGVAVKFSKLNIP
jgi:hypothetical protein